MPSVGDGFYYFSAYFAVPSNKFARLNIELNGDILCTAYTEQQQTNNDPGSAACSAAIYAAEGTMGAICFVIYMNIKLN